METETTQLSTEELESLMQAYFLGLPTHEIVLLLAFSMLLLAVKGLALWTAAQKSQKTWFVILLFLNTLGILEIIYLLFLNRKKNERAKELNS